MNWPVIRPDDAKGLDNFSIFLMEFEHAISSLEALKILENP